MAFVPVNFAPVANELKSGIAPCYHRYWLPDGDDVTAADYFPTTLGLKVGDEITVTATNYTTYTVYYVSAVDAVTGAVTVATKTVATLA